jgi:hypothetical protein
MNTYSEPKVVIKQKTTTPESIEWKLLWYTDGAEKSYSITIEESTKASHLEMWAVDEHTDELYLQMSFEVNTRGKIVNLFKESGMVPDCIKAIGFGVLELSDTEGWFRNDLPDLK